MKESNSSEEDDDQKYIIIVRIRVNRSNDNYNGDDKDEYWGISKGNSKQQ